jgi:hypothetical protein
MEMVFGRLYYVLWNIFAAIRYLKDINKIKIIVIEYIKYFMND